MENKRKLGHSSLEVSPIALGGNVFGWTLDEKQSFKILDELVDNGFNFIDTADTYSTWVPGNKGGESETIIGKWMKLRGNRKNLIIATKLGGDMGDNKKGLSPRYIKEAIEDSLRRLQTDYVDLYQSHYDDADTPIGDTMSAFNSLIAEGKVRFIGASNLKASRIKESNAFAKAHNMNGYISLQPLYNLYDRETFEKEYLPLAKEESLSVLPYYSLASGFLTGKYRTEADLNKSQRGGGIKKYLDPRGHSILAAMDKIAAQKNVPLSQIAIAWLLHKPTITAAIASATSESQLKDLVQATSLSLNEEEMNQLDKASAL